MNAASVRSLGWYCLVNAALFKLTSLQYQDLIPPAGDVDILVYRVLIDLSHWLYLALVLIGAPVFVLVALRRSRTAQLVSATALASAATALLYVDGVVFTQYRMHLGSYVWVLLFGGSGFETFHSISGSAWLMVFAGVLLVIGLQIVLARFCWRLGTSRLHHRPGAWVASVWTAAMLVTQSWHVWADATYDARVTAQTQFYPFYHPRTAKAILRSLNVIDPARARPSSWQVLQAGERPLLYPPEHIQCTAPPAQPNILLLIIDAWRFDQLNEITTPAVHEFARGSTVFAQHISGSNTTRFGMFSIFYGLTGNDWFPILQTHTPPVLMQQLVAQGYELAIYASAPLVHPEFDRTIFSGIQGLRLRTPGEQPFERDRRITADMIDYLGRRTPASRPFFGFLWYNSAHSFDFPPDEVEPFKPSSAAINYLTLSRHTDRTPYFNRYRNALHFIDGEVGRVLAALEATGELDETIVLVTGDHGQEFNDTGKNYWGHNSNFSPYQVHVPLIVRSRSWPAGTVHYMTSHYDMAPTLLTEALGCRTPPQAYSQGVPLMQASNRPAFVPVFDYDQMGVYQRDRITLVSSFGGFDVYTHDYDPLDVPADPAVMAQVSRQVLRFSRRPDLHIVEITPAKP